MEYEQELLKVAREQPNTMNGFANTILYSCLALTVAQIKNDSISTNRVKEENELR